MDTSKSNIFIPLYKNILKFPFLISEKGIFYKTLDKKLSLYYNKSAYILGSFIDLFYFYLVFIKDRGFLCRESFFILNPRRVSRYLFL